MARKWSSLDVVKMMATLTLERWRYCLETATGKNDVNKLLSYRYGLQAGLADAARQGLASEPLDIWVIKRTRDVERCLRLILKRKYKNPLDLNKTIRDAQGYIAGAKQAKRLRDREFEKWLQISNF